MKLKCLIGSISCNGVLAEVGDVFDMDDEAAGRLVKDGYAEIVEDKTIVEDVTPEPPINEPPADKNNKNIQKIRKRGI